MCLLAIKSPIGIRKIIVTQQKIAIITFPDTGFPMSIFHCLLFGQKWGGGKIFNLGVLSPMLPGFVAASTPNVTLAFGQPAITPKVEKYLAKYITSILA